jgi:glycosyltransferase involved in cell wall biosynthesis
MIDDRGLTTSVIIAGFKKNPYPWISHADLLVLSSDHEGFGNVIVEALECKTPVVSTDCPSGPAEILSQLPQCLTPVGNVEKLASKISRCLKNPPDLSQIDLSKYDVNSTIRIYENLAKGSYESK